MKYIVNDACIGCGLCEGVCPEVFSVTPAGAAEAIADEVPESAMEAAEEAIKAAGGNVEVL